MTASKNVNIGEHLHVYESVWYKFSMTTELYILTLV